MGRVSDICTLPENKIYHLSSSIEVSEPKTMGLYFFFLITVEAELVVTWFL